MKVVMSSNKQLQQQLLLLLHFYVSTLFTDAFIVSHKQAPIRTPPATTRTYDHHHYGRDKSLLLLSSIDNINNEDVEECDIVIFGGGFGGLYTALAIHNLQQQQLQNQSSKQLSIVLVEPTEQFVFLPLLYDLTVGTATEQEVCPTYNDIFQNTNIKHIRASFESIEVLENIDINSNTNSDTRTIMASIRPVNDRKGTIPTKLSMKAAIIAVGASPDSIISSVPGAKELVQPFYTANDAKQTRRLLNHLEKTQFDQKPRIAVIGGGYGGVELSASIQRRLPNAQVQLLCRGRPMANTRAENLVDMALTKLGVVIEPCNVIALTQDVENNTDNDNQVSYMSSNIRIQRTKWGATDGTLVHGDELPWDAVLWTAGSVPADPISTYGCDCLSKTPSGRIAIDATLRCLPLTVEEESSNINNIKPKIWALGDCAEITTSVVDGKILPKTAQVAMQQADTVAANVLSQLLYNEGIVSQMNEAKEFMYQDLGSMLTLGGPNAAVLAPKDDTPFGPIFAPLLDVAGVALGITDNVLISLGRTPIVEQIGIPTQETLGLSLGNYGLGVTDAPKGTLAGTLAGAARRTVYAIRMPTNQQRAVSLISATISTAAALIKESTDRNKTQ